MGIVGLTNTLAREGEKRNVLVNSIAPTAASRMTADIMPADVLALLKPDLVAPLVRSLLLSHPFRPHTQLPACPCARSTCFQGDLLFNPNAQ